MITKPQRLRDSKKAIVLGIALLNLNVIFVAHTLFKVDVQVVIQMLTSILFLSGIYTGVQGGVDMIQSNKFDNTKVDTTDTKITKTYEYKMDYVEGKK
jgi:hypothetical protein